MEDIQSLTLSRQILEFYQLQITRHNQNVINPTKQLVIELVGMVVADDTNLISVKTIKG